MNEENIKSIIVEAIKKYLNEKIEKLKNNLAVVDKNYV